MTIKRGSKKVLSLYPRFPANTCWSYRHALELINKRSSMPPLGLITADAMLPKEYEQRLKDLNIEELHDEDVLWADAVFISAMTVQQDSLDELIGRINHIKKDNKRHIPIVLGGPYPTQYYYKIKGADHFVLGEAEVTLEAFINDWEGGIAKKAYAHVSPRKKPIQREIDLREKERLLKVFGDDIKIIETDSRPSMASSPIPRFDLLDMTAYANMAIQSKRGCIHDCDFCCISALNGHGQRTKEEDRVIEELKAIKRLGYIGPVMIVDDEFRGNPKYTKSLLRRITDFQMENNYPFSF
jgi:radical SAM superfamily enzyme YgiQ (UPF0313 family)